MKQTFCRFCELRPSRIVADDEILEAFDRLRVWQRGAQRAVHKPLLVLFALARVVAGGTAMIDWNDAEPKLKELREEFGPDGSRNSRHNPSGTCGPTACGY